MNERREQMTEQHANYTLDPAVVQDFLRIMSTDLVMDGLGLTCTEAKIFVALIQGLGGEPGWLLQGHAMTDTDALDDHYELGQLLRQNWVRVVGVDSDGDAVCIRTPDGEIAAKTPDGATALGKIHVREQDGLASTAQGAARLARLGQRPGAGAP